MILIETTIITKFVLKIDSEQKLIDEQWDANGRRQRGKWKIQWIEKIWLKS